MRRPTRSNPIETDGTTSDLQIPDAHPDVDWPEPIQDYYWLHNILRIEPRLRYKLVLWRPSETRWLEISEESFRLSPYHFDAFFSRRGERDRFLAESMKTALASGRLHVGVYRGFGDIFYPVRKDNRGGILIHAGPIRQTPLSYAETAELWTSLSGRAPLGSDPDFRRYADVATDVPIIAPPVLAGLESHLALLARYLLGEGGPRRARSSPRARSSLYKRVLELRRDVFLNHCATSPWMELAIDPERFQLTPWQLEKRFAEWMQQEMGICRAPTTVLVLMPILPPAIASDPVATLVRVREVQWAAIEHARRLPETAAAPLERYGVYYLTSTRPRLSPERRGQELLDRAELLRRHVRQRCNLDAAVGIGSSHAPGESLAASYHAAVVAVHVAHALPERVHRAEAIADVTPTLDAVRSAARAVRSALVERRDRDREIAVSQLCHAVVSVAGSRADLGRGYLQLTLLELRDAVGEDLGQGVRHLDSVLGDAPQRLAAAADIHGLVAAFRTAVDQLAAATHRGVTAEASRFAVVLALLQARFREPLRLAAVARATGYSVATLTRSFRRVTGGSFLEYLVQLRLAHARRLLSTTDLTVERVAAHSGFGSVQHLNRTFQRHHGDTPAAYRKRERFRDGAPRPA